MSNYFNEAGEPLMDGFAMRYEMYLDSLAEYDEDRYYAQDEPEVDPDDCDHSDGTFLNSGDDSVAEGDYECDLCGVIVGRWIRTEDGWYERI